MHSLIYFSYGGPPGVTKNSPQVIFHALSNGLIRNCLAFSVPKILKFFGTYYKLKWLTSYYLNCKNLA